MQRVFPITTLWKSLIIQMVTERVIGNFKINYAGENLQERGECLQEKTAGGYSRLNQKLVTLKFARHLNNRSIDVSEILKWLRAEMNPKPPFLLLSRLMFKSA